MANFDREYVEVIKNEGGYVNDPDDAGGETYKGISRRANPNWIGWREIDRIKSGVSKVSTINKLLNSSIKVDRLVKDLYKTKYWDVFDLDNVHNQELAHQIFDTAVNMGVTAATSIAQQIVGMTITGKWSAELYYNLVNYGKV